MAKLFSIPTYKDPRGSLSVIEKILPFDINRVYYIYDVDNSERGYHAHKKTIQALIMLNGSCNLFVGDNTSPLIIFLGFKLIFLIASSKLYKF